MNCTRMAALFIARLKKNLIIHFYTLQIVIIISQRTYILIKNTLSKHICMHYLPIVYHGKEIAKIRSEDDYARDHPSFCLCMSSMYYAYIHVTNPPHHRSPFNTLRGRHANTVLITAMITLEIRSDQLIIFSLFPNSGPNSAK
jgi:hypothetical protein